MALFSFELQNPNTKLFILDTGRNSKRLKIKPTQKFSKLLESCDEKFIIKIR